MTDLRGTGSALRARALGPQRSYVGVDQPQLEVLVLVEQQLDVLHEQQLEQLHDELVAAMSIDGSTLSTTSNVAASSSSSSRSSVLLIRRLSD
ncbi:hypothetical protein [Actinomadura alba]|uniref:Uncharacterized protein n=1 Tax=Actinomadura alba TaxID=406431 RepID=A0ABR7LSY5_9ACTN|nr:hypothetical protein [Actinomadura alba]MBC6467889.1 hypothetical protein [Actinomadura alba]